MAAARFSRYRARFDDGCTACKQPRGQPAKLSGSVWYCFSLELYLLPPFW